MTDLSYQKYNSCDRCREGKLEEPEILCYYHQKMQDGLIDEPESEVAYSDIFCDDAEQVQIFQEQVRYVVNHSCPPDLRNDAGNYASLYYRRTLASWNPELASWATFCSNIIKVHVRDFMKKEILYGSRFDAMSDFVGRTTGDVPNPEELVTEKQKVDSLRHSIFMCMTDMTERQIVVLWSRMINHMPATQQQIADEWGTTRQSIIRDEEAIIKILRREINYVK